MNAKEKAIKHCKNNKLVVPFFSKKVNKVFDEALDIAIQEAKKEEAKKIVNFIQKLELKHPNNYGSFLDDLSDLKIRYLTPTKEQDKSEDKLNMVCKCSHDWNTHNTLTDEACDIMDCGCKKYNPNQSKSEKCQQ